MKIIELNLFDQTRSRSIPILVYTPDRIIGSLPVVIFSPGYQDQEDLRRPENILAYKKWEYLAEYFVKLGYALISIQHDMLGDTDGIESIDPKLPQAEARKPIWMQGEQNILFVISELKKQFPEFNFDKFIIAGHSNGADMAKFFSNNHENNITHVISFDGRRCPIAPYTKQKILMFEATDTIADIGVIPNEGTKDAPKRMNLEWVIIKPKDAFHTSYRDDLITQELKIKVLKAIEWFLT